MDVGLKELETKVTDHESRLQELEDKTLTVFHTLKIHKRYRERFNPVKIFFAECCVSFTGARITPPDLYNCYKVWCAKHGVKVLGKQYFLYAFRLRYPRIKTRRHGSKDFFFGIEMARPPQ